MATHFLFRTVDFGQQQKSTPPHGRPTRPAFAHSNTREHAVTKFPSLAGDCASRSSRQGSWLRPEKSFVVTAICVHRLRGHTHARHGQCALRHTSRHRRHAGHHVGRAGTGDTCLASGGQRRTSRRSWRASLLFLFSFLNCF